MLTALSPINFMETGTPVAGPSFSDTVVELMEKGLMERNFDDIQSYIEDTGEVNWLIQDALNKEIPIPIISQSVMELFKSRIKDSDTYKSIALMRHGFGGHPFGKDEYIAKERQTSRIKKI